MSITSLGNIKRYQISGGVTLDNELRCTRKSLINWQNTWVENVIDLSSQLSWWVNGIVLCVTRVVCCSTTSPYGGVPGTCSPEKKNLKFETLWVVTSSILGHIWVTFLNQALMSKSLLSLIIIHKDVGTKCSDSFLLMTTPGRKH